MAQAGWTFGATRVAPVWRYEKVTFRAANANNRDESRVSVGAAWFAKGHNSSLKLFCTRVKTDSASGSAAQPFHAVNVVWQVFYL